MNWNEKEHFFKRLLGNFIQFFFTAITTIIIFWEATIGIQVKLSFNSDFGTKSEIEPIPRIASLKLGHNLQHK